MEVPIEQIRPSPYQPRLTFDLDDILTSIKNSGILVPLMVRKVDNFYELIDGERRWQSAKRLGYERVPIEVVDADDATARRMVWKINSIRKSYTPKEQAYYFKRLREEFRMSVLAIARDYERDEHTVAAYLNVFKLPSYYQEQIWSGPIGIAHIRELETYLGYGSEYSESGLKGAVTWLNEVINRKLTAYELRKVLQPEVEAREKQRLEAIERAIPPTILEIPKVKLETPEEFERAAEALRREAERRKTAEQKAEEKRRKLITQVQKSLNATKKKIDGASKIIDVSVFRECLNEIEKSLEQNPAEVREQLIALRKEVANAKKQHEREIEAEKRRLEEEAKRKAEKELRRRLEAERRRIEKETREKLLKDREFLRQAAETAPRIRLREQEIPAKMINEIDVGEVECPKCGAILRLIHCEPGRTHKVERKPS